MSHDITDWFPTDVDVDRAISGPSFPAFLLQDDGFTPLGVVDLLHTVALAENALLDEYRATEIRSRSYVDTVNGVQRALDTESVAFRDYRRKVRRTAVAEHLADVDAFTVDALNAFLSSMGLDEYEPTVEVTFTVRVTATVTGCGDVGDALVTVWRAVEDAVESITDLDEGTVETIVAFRNGG